MKTTIQHADGSYTTPCRLEVNFQVEGTLTNEEQRKLNAALTDVLAIYNAHKNGASDAQPIQTPAE